MKQNDNILDDLTDEKPVKEHKKIDFSLKILFIFTFLFVSYGLLARIMHWPLVNSSLYIGIGLALVYFIFSIFKRFL